MPPARSRSSTSRRSKKPADPETRFAIVANRLPLTRGRDGVWSPSPGGLVSAILPVCQKRRGVWIGWSGGTGRAPSFDSIGETTFRAVEISRTERDAFYRGFSNATLWPLYHDCVRPPAFHRHWWRAYCSVNARFAEETSQACRDDATIWVHDYQLQLVPGLLRRLRPRARIGFYLHIPFPPQELFAQLPWRRELLEGMLGADVVGFQTSIGARNFVTVCRMLLGARTDGSHIVYAGRRILVRDFPISIDAAAQLELASSDAVEKRAKVLANRISGGRRILLGVDRLDYTKGVDVRLKAYETLLERYPELKDEVVFAQVAVPSREGVADYAELRTEIERLVGHINGRFGELGRAAVHYLYRSLPSQELAAFYRCADVMVVTPFRDGMNLVAKEYCMSRVDDRGVLVLSEFAGAAQQLKQALLVNPHDVDGVADTMKAALDMEPSIARRRMRRLKQQITTHDVAGWAASYLDALQ